MRMLSIRETNRKRKGTKMKTISTLCGILLLIVILAGCGETIRGIGQDVNRMGRGIKTIFVSE